MNINFTQLSANLSQSLWPFYILSGDEQVLIDDALLLIRQSAKQRGFDEHIRFDVTSSFDWSQFYQYTESLSLFGNKQIIELHFLNVKSFIDVKKIIETYCVSPAEHCCVILRIPKLEKKYLTQKWFKGIESTIGLIQIWPITSQQLPHWVENRLIKYGLTLSKSAIQTLCDFTEGNLVSCEQELKKLQLLYGATQISDEQLEQTLIQQARFDIFCLMDTMFTGDTYKTNLVYERIKGEGCEPSLILWAICRELRLLIKIHYSMLQGQNIQQIFTQQRVWQSRQALVKSVLARCDIALLKEILEEMSTIDEIIKGIRVGSAWTPLHSTIMSIAHGVKLHK